MTKSALAGALTYAMGQACSLAFQLLLLTALGATDYGRVGLAHLSLVTLLFVSDIGYGLYFLRERPGDPRWQRLWRMALGHRLFVALTGLAALGALWHWRYGGDDPGLGYLMAAAPAVLAALVNFSTPFLAAGRARLGFALQQVAWPVAALAFALSWPLQTRGLRPEVLAGLSVTLGYGVQALVNLVAARRLMPALRLGDLLLPLLARGGGAMLRASLALAALGFLGVANERLTAFLVESSAPLFLPAYLLLGQILGGAAGMLAQFNRLLVAAEATGGGTEVPLRTLGALLLAPLSALLVGFILVCGEGCAAMPAQGWRLGAPVIVDWVLSVLGGGISALLIGRRQEAVLVKVVVLGVAISMAGQWAGAVLGSADAVLWARVAGAMVALAATARTAAVALPAALAPFCMAMVLGALAQAGWVPWPWTALAGAVGLAAAMGRDAVLARRGWRRARQGGAEVGA